MTTSVTLQEENGDGERASKRMRGAARPHTSEDEVLQADSAGSLAASPTGGAPTEVGLAGHIKDFLTQFASSDDEEYAPREAAAPILLVSADPQPRAHILSLLGSSARAGDCSMQQVLLQVLCVMHVSTRSQASMRGPMGRPCRPDRGNGALGVQGRGSGPGHGRLNIADFGSQPAAQARRSAQSALQRHLVHAARHA